MPGRRGPIDAIVVRPVPKAEHAVGRTALWSQETQSRGVGSVIRAVVVMADRASQEKRGRYVGGE